MYASQDIIIKYQKIDRISVRSYKPEGDLKKAFFWILEEAPELQMQAAMRTSNMLLFSGCGSAQAIQEISRVHQRTLFSEIQTCVFRESRCLKSGDYLSKSPFQ